MLIVLFAASSRCTQSKWWEVFRVSVVIFLALDFVELVFRTFKTGMFHL